MPQSLEKTKQLLELAYLGYHRERHRNQDPISLVHRYSASKDREVAALFASLLSYGNVKTILQSVSRVLAPLGPSPYDYLTSNDSFALWPSFKHRFTTGEDIEILAHWISSALKSHGSLEFFFVPQQKNGAPAEKINFELKARLSHFVQRLGSQAIPKKLEKVRKRRSRNLKYLLSNPDHGSACKRLNMFLRWVVRPDDGIDLGLWTQIHPRELMLPIDTHLLQTLQKLRWTKSKQANWKVVESATQKLRLVAPDDPIRYDFALCHLSMSGGDIKQLLKGENQYA